VYIKHGECVLLRELSVNEVRSVQCVCVIVSRRGVTVVWCCCVKKDASFSNLNLLLIDNVGLNVGKKDQVNINGSMPI